MLLLYAPSFYTGRTGSCGRDKGISQRGNVRGSEGE